MLKVCIAISNGAMSVEADIWLYNDTLYVRQKLQPCVHVVPRNWRLIKVGHDTSSLTANRTFQTLYINPLVEVLTLQNPTSPFVLEKTRK